MWASPHSSTRSRARATRKRRIIRSARSIRTSAPSSCPMLGSSRCGASRKPPSSFPAAIEFVDIAGLVKGASAGEGLGNKFLTHVREVDAIVQVVRCFDDPDVHHVSGSVDPVRDIDIINTELILADMETVARRKRARRQGGQGRRQGGDCRRGRPHENRRWASMPGKPVAGDRADAGRARYWRGSSSSSPTSRPSSRAT